MIYSKSNIARLLGDISPSQVKQVTELDGECLVILKNNQTVVISRKELTQSFVNYRKEGARGLLAYKQANRFEYIVLNPRSYHTYHVSLAVGNIYCQCTDFNSQQQNFGRGCCKHIYAALAQLGYSSLSDYLNADF